MTKITDLLDERILFLDGAMGTMIQRHKLEEADYRGALAAGVDALLIDPMRRTPVPAAARLGSIFELEAQLGWTPSQSSPATP